MTDVITGFPPVADQAAKTLILGSMPGVDSLKMNQYYAHPRNAFWRIMGSILNFPYDADYEYRLDQLKKHHIALWDVVDECVRPGSLDSRIRNESVMINDFKSFFQHHTHISKICFNGATAENLFIKQVVKMLPDEHFQAVEMIRLPSTSPAMASMSFEQKLAEWAGVIGK